MKRLTAAALVVVALALGGCGGRVPDTGREDTGTAASTAPTVPAQASTAPTAPGDTGATEVDAAPAVDQSALDDADATLDEAERFLDALDQEMAEDEG